jgi:hypothetical protein
MRAHAGQKATDVNYVVSGRSLAIVDSPLGESGTSASNDVVGLAGAGFIRG